MGVFLVVVGFIVVVGSLPEGQKGWGAVIYIVISALIAGSMS